MMNRRDFSAQLAAAAALGAAAPAALAQGGPVEGTHYVRLSQPVNTSAPAGKLDLIEFFSYGCPACFAMEPFLEEWLKKLPADVAFRRVPVGFNANFEAMQRVYYGLESMGKVEALHKRIFTAVHVQRLRLDREGDMVSFLNANGVDGAQWAKATKEFHVVTKIAQAKRLGDAYKIDGVPTFGVHGRFFTGTGLAGDHQRALAVTDFLLQRVRKPT
jgi:thiol:disulfide interchange protein DsbA